MGILTGVWLRASKLLKLENMVNEKTFLPHWASPPGETILDILHQKNLSISDLAKSVNYSLEYIQDLLEGREIITPDIAEALTHILGGTAKFWTFREEQYQEDFARLFKINVTEKEGAWLRNIPFNEMSKYRWLPAFKSNTSKLVGCLRFFDVNSLDNWNLKYEGLTENYAFRTSTTFQTDKMSLLAWLRKGEIESKKIICQPWNSEKFKETLKSIRRLTRKKDPKIFVPELKKLCASCGVAVVIVRAPKGCRASGATRFISSEKAILQLSFRYLSNDQFWFSFFHEAGHLLLHSQEALFIEGLEISSDFEEEANSFAMNTIIPPEFQPALETLGSNNIEVMKFSRKIGIASGLVVGQMQHLGLIPVHHLNRLKVRYSWEEENDI